MSVSTCQHIKANGTRCGSPSLTRQRFCFFHQQWRPMKLTGSQITMPVLEDAASIQLAITQVTHMLVNMLIDHKTAGLVLYGLQVASSNLKRMTQEQPAAEDLVTDPDSIAQTPLPEQGSGDAAQPAAALPQHQDSDQLAASTKEYVQRAKLALNGSPYYTFSDAISRRNEHFRNQENSEKQQSGEKQNPSGNLPPGTIQASAECEVSIH